MQNLDEKAIQGILNDSANKWNGNVRVAIAAFFEGDYKVIDSGGLYGQLPAWIDTDLIDEVERQINTQPGQSQKTENSAVAESQNDVSIATQEQGAQTNQTEPAEAADGGTSENSAADEAEQVNQIANNEVSQPENKSADETAEQKENGLETAQTQESGNSEISGKTEEVAPVAAELTDDDFYQILKNHKPLERHIKEDLAVRMYGTTAIETSNDKKEFAEFVDLSLVSKNQGLFTKWVNSSLPSWIGNYKGE